MILCWILFVPFIGAVLCWQLGRRGAALLWPRRVALASMVLVLLPTLWLWLTGDFTLAGGGVGQTPSWTREVQFSWIARFGISFHLALDGLSLIMLLLTATLGILAVACSWQNVTRKVGFFYMNLLWLLGGVIGIFLAIDLFLYFFFWEMMLIPMYFLVALWGHRGSSAEQHSRAAIKFFIYTQASGLLMLAAIIGLVFAHYGQTGQLTFDYNALIATPVNGVFGTVLMLGFFIAFAVKLPAVPFHGWMPDIQAQSPTDGGVDLAGILVKTGAYSLLRFALPLFPQASADFAPIGMFLGLIGIYYGALMAFSQTDVKRLVSYATISHMGFVLVGIYAGTLLALQGVVVQMVASALSSSALFIISGQLYQRTGTRDMRRLGGLFGRMGAMPGFALAFVVASLGMPATANFIGEFLILFGAFSVAPWVVVIASGGMILAAVYALILMHRVYWGPPAAESSLGVLDRREYSMLCVLLVLTLGVGLFPQTVLGISQSAMSEVTHWFTTASAVLPIS